MLSQPVVDLLKALTTLSVKDFNKVSGAADFASAQEDLKITPAAYVIPLADTAQPNRLQFSGIEQHVTERFAVVLAVKNARDVRGDAVNVALETLRDKTINAVIGFVPDTGYEPAEYGGGRLLMLDVAVTWWQLEFITGYRLYKV